MKLALLLALLVANCMAEREVSPLERMEASSPVICACRCCYLGECYPLENASWYVSSCADCRTQDCQAIIHSSSRRTKIARTFEALQDGVPEEARTGIEISVCEVISVLEAVTCTTSECKRTTDVMAECFDRNEPIHKYTIISFLLLCFAGLIFGLVRPYIPALQSFNQRHFDY